MNWRHITLEIRVSPFSRWNLPRIDRFLNGWALIAGPFCFVVSD